MTEKDRIIKRLVVDTGIKEMHIKTIINDSFDKMIKAMKTNDIVELAGFGKWHLNRKKVLKDVKLITENLLAESSKTKQEKMYLLGRELITYIQDETELVANFRRMEEQFVSLRENKGVN